MSDERLRRSDEPSGRSDRTSTRRRYLRRTAAALSLAASATLAGCPQPGQTVFDTLGEDDGGSGDGGEPEDPPPVTREPDYQNWFGDVGNYQTGTAVYKASRETVTVTVGASGNGGDLAFAEPAIAVGLDTTVEWEWSGEGGPHNVVHVDGAFDSGPPETNRSSPFRHRFTETGTYRYRCETHADSGMKGAVTVYDPDA